MNATKPGAGKIAWALVLGLAMTSPAYASSISLFSFSPLIVAGDPNGVPPDSPANRVDPNVPASDFSGVVSINIRYVENDVQLSFICSGTLVSSRDVVTAGHCLDIDGNGTLIDITQPFTDVRVVFNAGPTPADSAVVTATEVSMHPDYEGFGNCPVGVPGVCLNDDIAVVHLGQDAPANARIYSVLAGGIGVGQLDTLVGYGMSGDGINGYTVGPDFRVKRVGENVMDLFDLDDEQNFLAGPAEVWYSDFDGNGEDTFCDLFLVCTPILANDREANIGGGDSGGPSFFLHGGEYFLMGNNTFGGTFDGQVPGAFGTIFGGMLIDPYIGYLQLASDGLIDVYAVPEPATLSLILAGLGLARARARRRKA